MPIIRCYETTRYLTELLLYITNERDGRVPNRLDGMRDLALFGFDIRDYLYLWGMVVMRDWERISSPHKLARAETASWQKRTQCVHSCVRSSNG